MAKNDPEFPATDTSLSIAKIPDVAEPLLGFRSWVYDPKRNMLRSVTMQNNYWPPGLDQHATCRRPHEPAQQECTCGVYAAYNIGYAAPYTGVGNVFGLVWGFGDNVVPADEGFRAQFGRMAGFFKVVPEVSMSAAELRRLANLYGVPLLDDTSIRVEDYRPILNGEPADLDVELRNLLREQGG